MKIRNVPHALWLWSIMITLALIVSPTVSGTGSFFNSVVADSTGNSVGLDDGTGSGTGLQSGIDAGTSSGGGSTYGLVTDSVSTEAGNGEGAAAEPIPSTDHTAGEITSTETTETNNGEIGSAEGSVDYQQLPSGGGGCGGGCGENFVDYSVPEEYSQEVGSTSSNPTDIIEPSNGGIVSSEYANSHLSSVGANSSASSESSPEQSTLGVAGSPLSSDVSSTGNSIPSNSPETSHSSNETGSADEDPSSSTNPVNQSTSGEPIPNGAELVNSTSTDSGHKSASGASSAIEYESSLASENMKVNGSPDSAALEEAISSDPNGVTRPIDLESNREISYGDVSNNRNVSADISFDKKSYAIGDSVQITVQDGDGNIDPGIINTIEVVIRSDSDKDGIRITLTESGPNTGQFVGNFKLIDSASTSDSIKVDPAAGDKLQMFYDSTHPRAQVTFDGINSPGTAHLTETKVTSVNDGGDFSEVLVGNAVELILADGAQLAANEAEEYCATQFAQPVITCGGHITMTLSYANAPLNNQIPSELTMFQKVGGTWLNLKEFGEVIVDENAKTVTVVTPFGPGIFTIGASIGGGGGGGGGIGLPGAGIVLDFVAEVSAPPPSEPPSSSPPTSGSDTSSPPEPSEIATPSSSSTSDGNTTSSSGQLQGSQSSSSQSQGAAQQDKSNARTGNVTINVPGEGFVLLAYRDLLSDGNLTAAPVKNMSDMIALDIAKRTQEDQGTLTTSDNTKYGIVGTVFKIGPSDARFNETVTVSIPYDSKAAAGKDGSDIRILQHSGSNWEDVTILPAADGHSVIGSISSLGPVVAAVKAGQAAS